MRITKAPEARRQEIIDVARSLFEKRGVDKTSMTEIAETIGVAKGLVYYYFSSKDQLAEEIIEQIIAGLDEALREILKQENLGFHAKLTAILNVYFQTIQRHPSVLAYSPAGPGMSTLIRERLTGIALHHTRALLQEAARQNLIRIEYPEYMLKILIQGLGNLYLEGVKDPQVHAILIEQTLGLEKGQLLLNGSLIDRGAPDMKETDPIGSR